EGGLALRLRTGGRRGVEHGQVRRRRSGAGLPRPGDPDPRRQRALERVRPGRPVVHRPPDADGPGQPGDGPELRGPTVAGPSQVLLRRELTTVSDIFGKPMYPSLAEWTGIIEEKLDNPGEEPIWNVAPPEVDDRPFDAIFLGGGGAGRFGASFMR